MVIDSIGKQVVQCDDPEMAELWVNLLAHLQDAALPYTVSPIY